jgi:small basic protein (TIGR04137 family)
MTQHRSLKASFSGKGHRNVLKRLERIKKLKEEEKWNDTKNSVFALPKVRSIKVKAKAKSKAEKDAAATEGAVPGAAAAPAPAAKSAVKSAAKPAAKPAK